MIGTAMSVLIRLELAAPGVQVWATVRVYMLIKNYLEERISGHNTYSIERLDGHPDTVMGGGQKHVLKGAMSPTVVESYILDKRRLEAIRHKWLRLNYQSTRFHGQNSAKIGGLHLTFFPTCTLAKTYSSDISKGGTLLIALRTEIERPTTHVTALLHKSSKGLGNIYATGEILPEGKDDRGSVVLLTQIRRKGPKYRGFDSQTAKTNSRLYSTRSRNLRSVPIMERPENKFSPDLETLAKHWHNCHSNTERVFDSLRGLYKLDSMWFSAYLKLKSNKGSKTSTPGPDMQNIDHLTRKRILEIKEAVLKKEYQ